MDFLKDFLCAFGYLLVGLSAACAVIGVIIGSIIGIAYLMAEISWWFTLLIIPFIAFIIALGFAYSQAKERNKERKKKKK